MKLESASRPITILRRRLGVGDGFAAAVAGLPGTLAVPTARDGGSGQAAISELFVNQETKQGLVHGEAPLDRISPCGAHARSTGKTYARAMYVMFRDSAADRGR